MTHEDIIRMAREAGDDWDHTIQEDREFLIRFADLVAAHEREECAKVCDVESSRFLSDYEQGYEDARINCAGDIRARGETK